MLAHPLLADKAQLVALLARFGTCKLVAEWMCVNYDTVLKWTHVHGLVQPKANFRLRNAVWARLVQRGWSYKQIADLWGVPVQTVNSGIHRSREVQQGRPQYDMSACLPTIKDEVAMRGVTFEDVRFKHTNTQPISGARLIRESQYASGCGCGTALCSEN